MKLKELRESKELKQSDVAKMLEVDTSTYGYWERGKTEPPIAMLIKLADLFDCTVDYLIDREDDFGKTVKNKTAEFIGNAEYRELIKIYSKLNNGDCKELFDYAEYLQNKHKV